MNLIFGMSGGGGRTARQASRGAGGGKWDVAGVFCSASRSARAVRTRWSRAPFTACSDATGLNGCTENEAVVGLE